MIRKTLVVLFLLAIGCSKQITTTTYTNIDRIFMHDRGHISFFIARNDDSITHTHLYLPTNAKSVIRYFQDVPEDEKMWIEKNVTSGGCDGQLVIIKVHMHSLKNVEGGSWDHGKHGSGTTNIVE